MGITIRHYHPSDFEAVSNFLIANYRPGNQDGNWLQPAWEYMHSHPNLDESSLDRIGIWEHGGQIVAVATYESGLGEALLQLDPDYGHLKASLLDYAEKYLAAESDDGTRSLLVYVNDFDDELEGLVRARGYRIESGRNWSMARFVMPHPFPRIELPPGFQLKSLADENNLWKIHRVLWRGFDHEGEPPEEGIEDRRKMQSGPNFRKDLTLVVEGPSGDFVSFCGMWFEPVNRYAYLEPMATDPDFRRMGLGKAVAYEGIRRCLALGAKEVFVGSDLEFYKAIGFRKVREIICWKRYF